MRGIVLRESLVDGLPSKMPAAVRRRYPHRLEGRYPVEVIEFEFDESDTLEVCVQLVQALRSMKFYAHVIDDACMFVAFPDCIALVRRGDTVSANRAQAIGLRFGIPRRQMRFLEMFDCDHPDSPAPR